MTHASVFSGIGGPEVAAAMLGWQNLFHCEINPFGRKVLDYWFPDSKSYEDITKTDFTEWRGKVNVLTGGFPCQPFSFAGKRRGAEDDRYLWPHMHRCINEIQPDWFIGENVAGILTMVEQGDVSEMASEATLFGEEDTIHRYEYRGTFTLERICRDCEADGYEVTPILVPACSVGAPHRRDRVFIIGHRLQAAEHSDQRTNERITRKPTGEDGCSRMEERNEIRQSSVANPTRSQGAEDAGSIADTNGHRGREVDEHLESELADGAKPISNGGQRYATDTNGEGLERRNESGREERREWLHIWRHTPGHGNERGEEAGLGRWSVFPSVSPIHRGDDGLPFPVDDLTISFPKWRNESIKAYGNAIVPQVMYEIFRAIEQVETP